MSKFKREQKYLVLKIEDIHEYLPDSMANELLYMAGEISERRIEEGKCNKSFVCISDDCPYYDDAWALVEKWWQEQQEQSE